MSIHEARLKDRSILDAILKDLSILEARLKDLSNLEARLKEKVRPALSPDRASFEPVTPSVPNTSRSNVKAEKQWT